MKHPHHPTMTAEQFRAALDRLGLDLLGLAHALLDLGDPRAAATVLRRVHAMAAGEIRVPADMMCLLKCFERHPDLMRRAE